MTHLLTAAETAGRLNVDRSVVLKLARAGRLRHAHKLPGRTGAYLFDPADVADFAANRDGAAA